MRIINVRTPSARNAAAAAKLQLTSHRGGFQKGTSQKPPCRSAQWARSVAAAARPQIGIGHHRHFDDRAKRYINVDDRAKRCINHKAETGPDPKRTSPPGIVPVWGGGLLQVRMEMRVVIVGAPNGREA